MRGSGVKKAVKRFIDSWGLDVSVSIDSRKDCMGKAFIAIKGERFDGHDFVGEAIEKGAVVAVVERDLGFDKQFVVDDTVLFLQELARLKRNMLDVKVIAITGSCGKTTTKDMIAHVLKRSGLKVWYSEGTKNNLIGLPLTLANMPSDAQVCVCELGTNSFGEIERLSYIACPDIAVITMIGRSHLEGLKDIRGVFEEKTSIINGMKKTGVLVVRADIPFKEELIKKVKEKGLTLEFFMDKNTFFVKKGPNEQLFFLKGKEFRAFLPFDADHLLVNALCCVSVCYLLGILPDKSLSFLENFTLPGGRMQIKEVNKVLLIDDSYNANPESTKAALSFIKEKGKRRIFVFGSMLELGDMAEALHEEIGAFAVECGVDVMITYGEEALSAGKAFSRLGGEHYSFDNHEDIVNFLKKFLKEGDVVLVKGSRGMRMDKVVEGLIN